MTRSEASPRTTLTFFFGRINSKMKSKVALAWSSSSFQFLGWTTTGYASAFATPSQTSTSEIQNLGTKRRRPSGKPSNSRVDYEEELGEAAFYGPKIDFVVRTSLDGNGNWVPFKSTTTFLASIFPTSVPTTKTTGPS